MALELLPYQLRIQDTWVLSLSLGRERGLVMRVGNWNSGCGFCLQTWENVLWESETQTETLGFYFQLVLAPCVAVGKFLTSLCASVYLFAKKDSQSSQTCL